MYGLSPHPHALANSVMGLLFYFNQNSIDIVIFGLLLRTCIYCIPVEIV